MTALQETAEGPPPCRLLVCQLLQQHRQGQVCPGARHLLLLQETQHLLLLLLNLLLLALQEVG
jgi:hypothetical protein